MNRVNLSRDLERFCGGKLMTAQQIVNYTGLTRASLGMMFRELYPLYPTGKRPRYHVSDVAAWLDRKHGAREDS